MHLNLTNFRTHFSKPNFCFNFSFQFQVTEELVDPLGASGHSCHLRGPIFVKGKGTITTYFVKTPFDKQTKILHFQTHARPPKSFVAVISVTYSPISSQAYSYFSDDEQKCAIQRYQEFRLFQETKKSLQMKEQSITNPQKTFMCTCKIYVSVQNKVYHLERKTPESFKIELALVRYSERHTFAKTPGT